MKHLPARYGPWAIVTGASSGIGKEFTTQLAESGMNVVLVARRQDLMEAHAECLRRDWGIETRVVRADLTHADGIARIKQATEALDIGMLVNNAGIETHGTFLDNAIEAELNLIALNVTALMSLTHYYGNQMKRTGRGAIVLLSSAFGYWAAPYFANYCGSKAYTLLFGEALHDELAPHNVDVLVLSPDLTKTEFMDRVADKGVDFSKIPFKPVSPSFVVRKGLRALGKKIQFMPQFLVRLEAFIFRRLMPRHLITRILGFVLRRARR